MHHHIPPKAEPFTGSRARFTHTQNYNTTLTELFPLLCPVRETEYLSRWACDILHLESGLIEPGGVFATRFPQDGPDRDIWVVSRYEKDKVIQFVRVNDRRSIIYNIKVQSAGEGKVQLSWEQIITGLNEEGNGFVEDLRQEDFSTMLDDMEKRLQYYLDTDEMIAD